MSAIWSFGQQAKTRNADISEVVSAAKGGTGLNTSSSTGIPQLSSGTWSVTATLANGTSATTQTAGDATDKVATDNFVTTAVSNYVLLNSQTVSGASVVKFDVSTSGALSSTYTTYEIVMVNAITSSASKTIYLRQGTGATPTYQTTGYFTNGIMVQNGTTLTQYSSTAIGVQLTYVEGSVGTFNNFCGTVKINNPSQTTSDHTYHYIGSNKFTVAAGGQVVDNVEQFSGRVASSTAVTGVELLPDNSQTISGTFELWGRK